MCDIQYSHPSSETALLRFAKAFLSVPLDHYGCFDDIASYFTPYELADGLPELHLGDTTGIMMLLWLLKSSPDAVPLARNSLH